MFPPNKKLAGHCKQISELYIPKRFWAHSNSQYQRQILDDIAFICRNIRVFLPPLSYSIVFAIRKNGTIQTLFVNRSMKNERKKKTMHAHLPKTIAENKIALAIRKNSSIIGKYLMECVICLRFVCVAIQKGIIQQDLLFFFLPHFNILRVKQALISSIITSFVVTAMNETTFYRSENYVFIRFR